MGARQFADDESYYTPYIRLAWDLDTSWMEGSACRGTPEGARRYWDAEPEGNGCRPAEARIAREFCRRCPSQWDCVTYAIEAKMRYCTWAVHAPDRRLLEATPNWKDLIAAARTKKTPVAEVMLTLRAPKRYERSGNSLQSSHERETRPAVRQEADDRQ